MAEEDETIEEQLPLGGIGQILRDAREAKGLSIAQVASETRINSEHLQLIEAGKFSKLPGRTYAIGFSRSYARLVGLDEKDVASDVRAELDQDAGNEGSYAGSSFEPGDPARLPGGKLALFSIFAAALFLAGIYVFYRSVISPAADLPALQDEQLAQAEASGEAEQTEAELADAAANGPVIFTSLEEGIWVKFYDANGSQLMQKQMALGEKYTVPADAEGPQLWTGRPDALSITVGGQNVPKLAEEDQIMRDIPVTPSALLERGQEPETPAEGDAAAADAT